MDTTTIIELLPPTITLILTSLFGLMIGIFVEKFKNRYRVIDYSIRSQKIIPPLSKNLGGNLSIKINEKEVKTLKITTIEIENKSSIDLENIIVTFSLSNDCYFQGNEAFLTKIFSSLYWTPNYNSFFSEVVEKFNSSEDKDNIPIDLQNSINYLLSNREYLIPVFNRKEKAIFNFLIEDPIDGSKGFIYPSIVHKSVKFVLKSDIEKKNQRDLWIGIIIGMIVVAIVIILMVLSNPTQKLLIICSALVGFSYSIVGSLLLRGARKIISFFK